MASAANPLDVSEDISGSVPVRARISASVARLVAHHAFSAASRMSPGLQQPQRVGVNGTGVGEYGGYAVGGYHCGFAALLIEVSVVSKVAIC